MVDSKAVFNVLQLYCGGRTTNTSQPMKTFTGQKKIIVGNFSVIINEVAL